MSLRSPNSPWRFWFPKRPFWKSNTQTNIGRGPFLSFADMSVRSPNSPWSFWFPKRPFWKASLQINIGSWDSLVTGPKEVWNWSETPSYWPSQTHSLPKVAVLGAQYSSKSLKKGVDSLILSHFPLGEKAYGLLMHLGALGLLISKTAVLEIKYSNKYWKRAVDTSNLW